MAVTAILFDNGGSTALTVLVLAIVGGLLISHRFGAKIDPREPPVVRPTIPIVGHVIGLMRKGPAYFKEVGKRTRYPIVTLPMLNGRMYIASSPALASQIQRASTSLDFEQMTVSSLTRLFGINKETQRIVDDVKYKEEGRRRMINIVTNEVIHPLLSLKEMDSLAAIQLQHFSERANALPDDLETGLFKSVTREITAATMRTFYGPENPFAVHPELIQEFWNWEADIFTYMIGVLPQFTARKAYIGINKCAEGFAEYLEKGRQAQASELIRRRQKAHNDVGISLPEQGRLEVAISLAFNVNAGITTFWLLNNICSRPSLLAEIREEIQTNALISPNTISYSRLRDKCPLLNSVYRETMRISAALATSRYVLEDTTIADTYLLRKDSVVQVIGQLVHTDKEVWGPDADSFNPRRFYYTPNGTKTSEDGKLLSDSKAGQVHPAAFRSFGGGASLCPGRHFAQMEITSWTALLLMGFDIQPPKGQEKVLWDPPEDPRFQIAVIKPGKEVNVRLTRRKGFENVQWSLQYQ